MNLTSRVNWFLSLVGAVAVGIAGTSFLAGKSKELTPTAPLISLEKMGPLASLKVSYADVIEFTQNRTLGIPWSKRNFGWAEQQWCCWPEAIAQLALTCETLTTAA